MDALKRMNEIAELIKNLYPAPTGTYVICLVNKHFAIKPAKEIDSDEIIIARLKAEDINRGLPGKKWDSIRTQIEKFNEMRLL